MNTNTANKDLTELIKAFDEIQMPRSPFALEKFVVGSHFTDEQKYAQCVLELQIAYDNLRLAELHLQEKDIEMDELRTSFSSVFSKKNKKTAVQLQIKSVEKEQLSRAVLGAMREFEFLYALWEKWPKKYTRDELNAAQKQEYTLRLETQAMHDKNAHGRISVGNQEGLRQIGKIVYPELDVARNVEQNYLKEGEVKILIAVPTVEKAVKGLPCLNGLVFPSGVSTKIHNCFGMKVDDAYNQIAQLALNDRADYLITIEDDTFPQPDAILKLYELIKQTPRAAFGAWYPKREPGNQGVHIVMKDGHRQQLAADGGIHEVYTLAMGCSIYPVSMFMEIPFPWFKTTLNLSQDSFFSQLARERGYKLLVDTSIQCKHVDRETGTVYGFGIPSAMQIPEELEILKGYAKGKKLICEIGTALGGTLYQLIQVAADDAEIFSIDLPGGKFGGEFGQPSLDEMASWIKKSQKLHVIRNDSKDEKAISDVKKLLAGRKFDFLFIDGDHSYEGVKADYENYEKFVDGFVAFHDIAEHNREDVGVRKFWKELSGVKREYINNEKQGWAGVGIIKVNNDA